MGPEVKKADLSTHLDDFVAPAAEDLGVVAILIDETKANYAEWNQNKKAERREVQFDLKNWFFNIQIGVF